MATPGTFILKKNLITGFILFHLAIGCYAQKTTKKFLFAQKNLMAWCIVPFDSKQRTPAERTEMLERLNFSQYAYDWRHPHLDSFSEEIKLAKKHHITVAAVWLWIDKNSDSPGKLSEDNERLLEIIKENGIRPKLWVGFNDNYYAYDDEQTKIDKAAEMFTYLKQRTSSIVSGLALYNHGDWFGEPENEIKILKQLNDPFFGLVYNFHHGHSQIEFFPTLVEEMKPWLWTVNINGMKKEGPKIMTLGSGDKEGAMLKVLLNSGFKGSIGILCHIEDEDAEVVLKRNVAGLRKLEPEL